MPLKNFKKLTLEGAIHWSKDHLGKLKTSGLVRRLFTYSGKIISAYHLLWEIDTTKNICEFHVLLAIRKCFLAGTFI